MANVQLTVWSLKTTEDPGLNPVMGNLSRLYLLLTVKKISLLIGFVYSSHPAALCLSPKHAIYAFIIYSQICSTILACEKNKKEQKETGFGPFKKIVGTITPMIQSNHRMICMLEIWIFDGGKFIKFAQGNRNYNYTLMYNYSGYKSFYLSNVNIYAYLVRVIKKYGTPSRPSPVLYVSQMNLSTQPGFVLALSTIQLLILPTIRLWAPSPKYESRNPASSFIGISVLVSTASPMTSSGLGSSVRRLSWLLPMTVVSMRR